MTGNTPTSITVVDLSPGSVIVNSQAVYSNTASSTSDLSSLVQSALRTAAVASSSGSTFPVDSSSITVKTNGLFVFIFKL